MKYSIAGYLRKWYTCTMRYRPRYEYVWSDNIAYSVGLMASDGCLQSDNMHLDLTSIDIDQLQNFCTALGRNLRITNKFNGE